MNNFYNNHCTCYHGNCEVTMSDNSKQLVKNLKKGDVVMAGNGLPSTIVCILKTVFRQGKAHLIHLDGGLLITAWHPIRLNNAWAFPINVGTGFMLIVKLFTASCLTHIIP